MTLKPWREIAQPHRDVLEGTFKQSEFAADISLVAAGKAPEDYQEPEKFFARTYITEGMRLLLVSVAQRLAGQGGEPVVQLQTAFGGGKTHTLLAVLHMASREVGTEKLHGIPPLLDEAGISDLPRAHIAVLDGVRLAPNQPRRYGQQTVNTLWGELAWQLLGADGYALVADSDASGTSPGKETLAELIGKASPCVLLMDELVGFMRQLELGQSYTAGTFDSNISFIHGLTEAVKNVPDAILLASLPESDLEIGGPMGQRTLESLEAYFARVESIWKPVGSEEAFEVVRRRLFEEAGGTEQVEGICRQFSDHYRANAEKFPTKTQSNKYFERMCRSYPIHPEIFDRLYEDWSTLEKFQRTRGVLQLMAIVIHRLWNSDNSDALIMPGSLPLDDTNVRNKSIHYLPQGWEPVLEREVDGPRSAPHDLDGHNTLFGSVQAARRTARTIFLGSAPSAREQTTRGIQAERILLGAVQPEQAVGNFEDALKRLRDRLHYLYAEKDRYWFDTKPNLRREMESRKQQVSERDELKPLLRDTVKRAFGRDHKLGGIHIFTPSADVPDDYATGPRLVVLSPEAGYSRTETNQAFSSAESVLRHRGEQPRQKQNRLIFLAPDFDTVSRLKDQGRTLLAWKSIADDIENERLVQDITHLHQAREQADNAARSLKQLVRETWRWLLAPREEFGRNGGAPRFEWEVISIASTAPNLVQTIENTLHEEEWVIYEWSPIHLRNLLQQWYFTDEVAEVSAIRVWQDTCHYLYMPRLVNDRVFRDAVARGAASLDYFGFAAGRDGDRYLGFHFGKAGADTLDEHSLLIERETAEAYAESIRPAPEPGGGDGGGGDGGRDLPGNGGGKPTTPPPVEPPPQPTGRQRFYGTVTLDPIRAKSEMNKIIDEVVQHFTENVNSEVSINVEIQAENAQGFADNLKRAVRENCRTLEFRNSEFEDDEN